jgi:hypothetical protein
MYTDEASLCITPKKFRLVHPLKTTSFQQFQIVQIKAQSPTRIQALVFLSIPLTNYQRD